MFLKSGNRMLTMSRYYDTILKKNDVGRKNKIRNTSVLTNVMEQETWILVEYMKMLFI